MKLSVSNLPQSLSEDDVKKMFNECGTVKEIHLKRDKKLGVSLGFGTVEMDSVESGNKAIEKLNGKEIQDKKIVILDVELVNKQSLEDKHGAKGGSAGSGKIQAQKSFGSSQSTNSAPRRSGGGGRGK